MEEARGLREAAVLAVVLYRLVGLEAQVAVSGVSRPECLCTGIVLCT